MTADRDTDVGIASAISATGAHRLRALRSVSYIAR